MNTLPSSRLQTNRVCLKCVHSCLSFAEANPCARTLFPLSALLVSTRSYLESLPLNCQSQGQVFVRGLCPGPVCECSLHCQGQSAPRFVGADQNWSWFWWRHFSPHNRTIHPIYWGGDLVAVPGRIWVCPLQGVYCQTQAKCLDGTLICVIRLFLATRSVAATCTRNT